MSVDTLMEEVARLKAELAHQSALWQTALGHVAEQDARIKDLVADREAVDEALAGVRHQRDALADALLSCDWSYGRAQSDEVHEKIDAALRLAGRLPQSITTKERTQE